MFPLVLPLLQFIPSIVGAVETLSHHKTRAGGEAIPGPTKLAAVERLIFTGLEAGGMIAPGQVGEPERLLVTAVTNAVVSYNNARGWGGSVPTAVVIGTEGGQIPPEPVARAIDNAANEQRQEREKAEGAAAGQ